MSFRDKAREVKEAGVAERGNFAPSGVPLRIYKWWLKESSSKRARAIKYGSRKENFCHFWRVVALWAPLRAFWYGFLKASPWIGGLLGLCAVGVLVWAATHAAFWLLIGQATLVVLGLALFAGGILGGISLGMSPAERNKNDMFPLVFAIPAVILCLPVGILTYLFTKAFYGYKNHLRAYDKPVLITALAALVSGVVLWVGLGAGWTALVTWLGVVALTLVVIAVAIFAGVKLSDYVSGRRALRRAAADQYVDEYFAKHGELPPVKVRKPSRIGKFFSGLGDFIILLAQVVRVNKWKICPIVEVETE